VEADIGAGLPRTVLVGLPDSALYQARDRCKAAVSNSQQEWPISLLTINLSPATLPKAGSHYDLAASHADIRLGHLMRVAKAAQVRTLSCRERGRRPGVPPTERTEARALQAIPPATGTPGSIGRSNALFTRWFDMHLSSSSAAGVRFLTSVREGRGLNRSAREAGVGKETGYRWLREAYVAHRRGGKSIAETEAVMGLASAKSIAWEAAVAAGPGRHHLRVAVDTEVRFWAVYDAGTGADAAASAAGVGRSTAYRWLERRFCELRAAGFTVKVRSVCSG
jgi:transposase-like protein